MAAPKFGHDNFFEDGTVTVTSEATGFEKENAYDWNTADFWKAAAAGTVYITVDMTSAITADYWAIAAHDLFDNSGTVQCQYSSDNFSADTNNIGDLITPTDNTPIMHPFTPTSARYWRLEIVSTGSASKIGVASIGEALTMIRAVKTGFQLPYESRKNKIINQRSEGGAFIGRSIVRQGVEFSATFELQTLAFVRGDWRTFIDHAEVKPFFFSWNPDYAGDAILAWMIDNQPGTYSNNKLLDVGLTLQGLRT